MGEHTVWDGSRAQSQRVVLAQRELSVAGLSARLVTENVSAPTDWCFREPHHTVVVHLAGQLQRMESVFSEGPSTDVLPAVGDTWFIPAGCQYAALAQGDSVSFAEFCVPASKVEQRDLHAQVAHRDAFLHQASVRLACVAQRCDDLGLMMQQSLLDTLRVHLTDAFLSARPGASEPARARHATHVFSTRQRQVLIDHIAAHASGPITVDALAAAAGVSNVRFLRSFKASFGTTPWQYVLRYRLAKGRRLLDSSAASVTSIAAAVGFSSPSHFATAFGRQFGVSPVQYRASRTGSPM